MNQSKYHGGQSPPFPLAENMTISAEKQSNMSGQNNTFDGKRLVMQVNKYIPHYLRIPSKLDKKDITYI